jgi:phosphoribosylamine--glycine ligase
MRILIVGCGAREQAIAYKFRNSATECELFSWPSNIAMQFWAKPAQVTSDAPVEEVANWGTTNGIELVVVGPEIPLSQGIADCFAERKIAVFGPKKYAAQLESSKRFAKEMMQRIGIPTAEFKVHTEREACHRHALSLYKRSGRVVLKASGLAGGKGVFVCSDESEIAESIARLYETSMQSASEEVVVEEFMSGRESSFFCTIGKCGVRPIGFAVDHKRLNDDDAGPNTGGMGCYAPVPWQPLDAEDLVMTRIVRPLVDYLNQENIEYCGWLYVGLMWDPSGPRVVEFNVRLGDPEAEVLAMADSSDWLEDILQQVGKKPLDRAFQKHDFSPAVCVVMASSDYPFGETSLKSSVLPQSILGVFDDSLMICGSAIKQGPTDGMISTQRGRVFTAVATSSTLSDARQKVYAAIARIHEFFPSGHFRRDIADHAKLT